MTDKNIQILVDPKYQPLQSHGQYSLTDTPITKEQIEKIFSRTPAEHKHTRPAKGGGQWEYVTGVYVKKVLSYLFGFLWDFEVTDKGNVEVNGKIVQVWVQGKLTIKNPKTFEPMIIKTQFGGADVKYMKSNKNQPLDYANDLKAATTDALKKCASELGIASDVYGKNEFKDMKQKKQAEKKATPKPQAKKEETKQQTQVDYLEKLKNELKKRGAKTAQEAVEIYNKVTGENIKSLNIAQSTAKKYLFNLLNSPTAQ